MGNRDDAGRTPTCPEIDEYDFTALGFQIERMALKVDAGKLRRLISHLQLDGGFDGRGGSRRQDQQQRENRHQDA